MENLSDHSEELDITTSPDSRRSSAARVTFAQPSTDSDSNFQNTLSRSSLSLTVSENFGSSRLCNGNDAVRICSEKRKRLVLDCNVVPFAKRRLTLKFEDEFAAKVINRALKGLQYGCPEAFIHMTDFINQRINIIPRDMTIVNNLILCVPSIGKPNVKQAMYKPSSIGLLEGGTGKKALEHSEVYKETVISESETDPALPRTVDNVADSVQANREGIDYRSIVDHMTTYYSDDNKQRNTLVLEAGYINSYFKEATKSSVAPEQMSECCDKREATNGDAISSRIQLLCESFEPDKGIDILEEKHHSRSNQILARNVQKLRQDDNCDVNERKRSASITSKDNKETKILPTFESYLVEEEEGSGGYGTVYKARRKTDETTVAIKCPHANAHRHHVKNEQRMLEQFGGKNFVIKYEGCLKSGNTDCVVLEHVEHDRPEVLKKEIDVLQLQWYGYCMFKAISSLHKQGIIHRDVKPGNFLFSRKTNKGYLIDFNLAMDLHQKYGNPGKQKLGYNLNIGDAKFENAKSVPQNNDKKPSNVKSSETFNLKTKGFKSTLDQNSLRRKGKTQTKANSNCLSSRNISKFQGADGSGITSTKDATSTITPSAERIREPLPCQGRKELISLVQKARQSPNGEVSIVPSPMRKRVAAPLKNVDSSPVYLTPMPLGVACMINGGDGKQKREGPCVGTKGFRAPEVLFKSPYQGPKMDTWSAGVTLLYLIIGRTPFIGDPEQNIKDIAKLRGSEDLWEVAKLHNRESSFPTDLYKAEFLPSVKLRDWCELNTKRSGFLKKIPKSLFDIVDKCLTVNPRLRISAEEALKHEFFAPCHEALRKQRLLRQTFIQDSSNDSSHDQSIIKQVKTSRLK